MPCKTVAVRMLWFAAFVNLLLKIFVRKSLFLSLSLSLFNVEKKIRLVQCLLVGSIPDETCVVHLPLTIEMEIEFGRLFDLRSYRGNRG